MDRGARAAERAPLAHRPARALPPRVLADMQRDGVAVHALVVVPALVVVADMLEAEPDIFVEPVARFRRPVFAVGQAVAVRAALPRRRRRVERIGRFDEPLSHWQSMGLAPAP